MSSKRLVPENTIAFAGCTAFRTVVTFGGIHHPVPITLYGNSLLHSHLGQYTGYVGPAGIALPCHSTCHVATNLDEVIDAPGTYHGTYATTLA